MLAPAAEIVVRTFPGRPWPLLYLRIEARSRRGSRGQCSPSMPHRILAQGPSRVCQEVAPLAGLANVDALVLRNADLGGTVSHFLDFLPSSSTYNEPSFSCV